MLLRDFIRELQRCGSDLDRQDAEVLVEDSKGRLVYVTGIKFVRRPNEGEIALIDTTKKV